MKRALIPILVFTFWVCAGGLFAQETQKRYSYTFQKHVADCTFPGVSIDQIWPVLVKTFMTQNPKGGTWNGSPVDLDRPSNHMVGTWVTGRGLTSIAWRLELLLEQRAEAVGIYCTISFPAGKSSLGISKSKWEAAVKTYFDSAAKLLYGPDEKK